VRNRLSCRIIQSKGEINGATAASGSADLRTLPFTGTDPSRLKEKSVRGGIAVLLSQGTSAVLQLGTLLVLARLLSPTDYGLQAMVLSLTNLVSLLKDAGLNFATVNREKVTHEQISTLFWINVALGVFLTLVVAAAGRFLVIFYKDPRLLWITVASSSIFLFNSLAVQHRALLDRAMRFMASSTIDISSVVAGTVVAIVMAAKGYGYWSLICQNIILSLLTAIGTWIAIPWVPGRPRWTSQSWSMVRSGGVVTLNSITMYFAYNTEKILLGHFWGPALLGIYGRAYQLANLPVQQITNSMGSVAFPMLSRLQSDPPRLRRSYLKLHSLVVIATVPMVFGCAIFADEIVRVALGPKWRGAALILRLLSPAMLVFALMNPLSYILRATGKVERSLKIALLIAPVVILGIVVGLRYGPAGVAGGYSIAMLALWIPLVAWAKHGTGITNADYWDCIKRPLVAATAGGGAGVLVKLVGAGVLPSLELLVIELAVAFTVYNLLMIYAMGQKDLYLDVLRQVLRRSRPMAT
jgi:O-antigen/teichoic acid export membrane protein